MGFLYFPGFQWLDAVGPVDLLNNHSHQYLSQIDGVPKTVVDKAPSMNWHYISSDLKPVQASCGPPQQPSTTYKDCPPLDYIIVPGPHPTAPLPEGCIEFLQQRYADPHLKAFLLVCTSSIAISQAGIMDGHKACSNKWVLRELAKAGVLTNKVEWVGDRRWIVDGKIWSAAGITAGMDLAVEFAKKHFDEEVVKTALELSEYTPLPDKPDAFAYILEGVDLA
ncbi:class I glutamine amidotransferase-like protein [Agrocybe pediades]|nr:class I glutamine amidotransferase-like protein [Agrocybe pediades]